MPPQFRFPKLVTPSSAAPGDVAKALGDMEMDAVNALVREPLAALGLSIPVPPPSPGTLMAGALAQLPVLPAPAGVRLEVGAPETKPPVKPREWKIE